MTETTSGKRWRPARTTVVAGSMVMAGFVLLGVSWWFLLLVALGAFGPGILREMGCLHDRDEFQRRADHRAGYHAFLACGLVACGLVALFRSGEREIRDPEELATLFLALVWFVWIFSSLLAYWGAQKTAARILVGFGCAWLAFTIASNVGSEWTGWPALLLHPLLTLPIFGLAWLSRGWPRVSGVLLLAAAALLFELFGLFRRDNLGLVTQGVTFLLFLGPLIASGIALLAARPRDGEDDAEELLVAGK